MTLRRKTLLIIGVTNLVLILLLYAHSQIIVLSSFARLEEQIVRQDVEQASSALSDEINTLDTIVSDWASWDDTYAFIEDGNQDYVQSNLVDETFTNSRLNLMLFVDASERIVWGKAFDLDSEEEVPVPKGLQEHLSNTPFLLRHPDTQSSITGIVLIPEEEPMTVASRPILTSEEEGPIRGTLVMGRYLDSLEIEHLAKVTHLSLSVYPVGDPQMPPDFQTACASLSAETPVFVQPLSAKSIAGYALLEDVYGNPALVLRVDIPREVYVQGQSSVLYFVLALVGISSVLGVVVVLFLERVVLSRLARLSSSVSNIGIGYDRSVRVPVTGKDELSDLANVINEALSALEQSQGDLRESEKRYRLLFNSGTDLVLVSEVADEGTPGRIIEANEIACQRLGYTKEEFLELTPLDIVDPQSRRDFPALAQGFSAEKPVFFEIVVVARTGVEFPAEISTHLFEFDGQPALLLIVRDITDRRRAEEALRASEQRFQDVARTIGDWIWETDVEGRYTYANPVVEQVLGYTPEEVTGRFYYDFFHPSNRDQLKAQVQKFFRERRVFVDFISSNTHRDGWEVILKTTGLPLVRNGQLLGYRGGHRDVTAEMEVERSLNAIATLGRGLVLSRDEQQIASTTVNAVRLLLRCHLCELWLVNEEKGEIVNQACLVRGRAMEAENLPVDDDKSIIAAVVRSGESIYAPDVQKDPRFIDAGLGTRSELCVPLKIEERVIGALNVEGEQVDAFQRSERQLLSALADQAALAIENAHLYTQMRAGRDRLQALSRRLVEVRENERRHIARELHDEIGQLLTGLKLVLQMSRGSKAVREEDEPDEALDLVDELLRRVRGLTLSLRATMLDDLGLLPALRWHFEHYTTQTGVRVAFKHVGLEGRRLGPEVEMAAYRIVQESLTNVARHAGVNEVTVRLWADLNTLGVQIQDQGAGFDVGSTLASPVSGGLPGMYERVSLLDGRLAIDSTPGAGTLVTAEFPLEESSTKPLGRVKSSRRD